MKPTAEQIQRIEQRLVGTANVSLEEACEEEGLTEDDVAGHLEVERCEECGWWCETSELVTSEGDEGVGRCEDCRG